MPTICHNCSIFSVHLVLVICACTIIQQWWYWGARWYVDINPQQRYLWLQTWFAVYWMCTPCFILIIRMTNVHAKIIIFASTYWQLCHGSLSSLLSVVIPFCLIYSLGSCGRNASCLFLGCWLLWRCSGWLQWSVTFHNPLKDAPEISSWVFGS